MCDGFLYASVHSYVCVYVCVCVFVCVLCVCMCVCMCAIDVWRFKYLYFYCFGIVMY